jgi:SIR2-like domain
MSASTAEIDGLVNGFARAAFEGNAAFFLGAGISRPSGLVGWSDLLRPLAQELGLDLGDHDDLPAIAQYYINRSSGNRGPLVQHLRHYLARRVDPSVYHREVARSSVGTIWTTNYDQIMEAALAGLKHRVRVRESDMVELTEPGTVELIKAHGSFNVSRSDELIIATEDYEDFAYKRPAVAARLRGDLLQKSFLFLGYGYGDPNIQTALVEARRLAERATLPHWMLTTACSPKNQQEVLRQELWRADLARIGIRCALMKDYASIEAIVSRIARMSRGPTLYVTGSHTSDDPRAADVGRLLADPKRPRAILLDGQSTGVSRTVLSQFQTSCIEQRVDLNERLKFFPNPYAANPRFSNDPSLLPLLKQWRGTMLRKANSALVFDGGMGTEAEAEIALELGCRIIPAPQSRTSCAYRLLDNPTVAHDLNHRCPGYITAAKDFTLSAEAIVDCVLMDMPPWPR